MNHHNRSLPAGGFLFRIKPFTLIRIGLAIVFLANSLAAFLSPGEFIELISGSFLADLLPIAPQQMVIFIGVNDAIVSILLFSGFDLGLVAVWAALWIAGAMTLKGFSLSTLEEAGFLFMAIDLVYVLWHERWQKGQTA